MARNKRTSRKSLLGLSMFTLLIGLMILLMAWWPLHQQSTREVMTHTGTLEQSYSETHPSGRSTVTYYCFVVDGETYYVSPIVWRALDRIGVAALEPGTQLHLTYWADMPARQLERSSSSRELLSIASDAQVYMSEDACMKEKQANGQIGVVLGGVFLIAGVLLLAGSWHFGKLLYRQRRRK